MLKKMQLLTIGLFFCLFLSGIQSQAFAQTTNQSVKECLEQPENCGEEQGAEVIDEQTDGEQLEASKESKAIGLNFGDFFKMIFATLFVVVLLYVVLKLVNKKGMLHNKSDTLVSLGGLTVGTNRSVQLIKVGERLLVVGVGENIQLLTEIEKGQEFDQIIINYNQKLDEIAQPSDFITRIVQFIKGRKKEETGEQTSFQMLLKKQLNELSNQRKKTLEELNSEKDQDKS
jgi:flagellar protein FliO/FliZ